MIQIAPASSNYGIGDEIWEMFFPPQDSFIKASYYSFEDVNYKKANWWIATNVAKFEDGCFIVFFVQTAIRISGASISI